MSLSRNEYWTEVREIAEFISDNRPTELGGTGVAADYGEDFEPIDALHERIDGHEWVIYSKYHFAVVGHSDNPDYMIEEFGSDGLSGNFDMSRTYWALRADVSQEVETDKYDLDEIREEKFQELLSSPAWLERLKEIISKVTVPNWSSESVEVEMDSYGVTLEWVPNASFPRTITVSDEHYNTADIIES